MLGPSEISKLHWYVIAAKSDFGNANADTIKNHQFTPCCSWIRLWYHEHWLHL